MENQTLRDRLARLRNKSRRALSLYKKMSHLPSEQRIHFSDLQVQEWARINAQLVADITSCIEEPSLRNAATGIFAVRDHYQAEWRSAESQIHEHHHQLLVVAEKGDYAKAVILAHDLISLKARTQACQAAYNEVQGLIDGARLSNATQNDSSQNVCDAGEWPAEDAPNVIPLRRKR